MSILTKWQEVKQVIGEVAGIAGSVAGVLAAVMPASAPIAVPIAAVCAILAGGSYAQKVIPDKYLPDPLKTGTSGPIPKAPTSAK